MDTYYGVMMLLCKWNGAVLLSGIGHGDVVSVGGGHSAVVGSRTQCCCISDVCPVLICCWQQQEALC